MATQKEMDVSERELKPSRERYFSCYNVKFCASSEAGKQEIEELVNACYNDVMAKVRQELPLLKGPELDLLRYIYAGFSWG